MVIRFSEEDKGWLEDTDGLRLTEQDHTPPIQGNTPLDHHHLLVQFTNTTPGQTPTQGFNLLGMTAAATIRTSTHATVQSILSHKTL